MTSTSITANVLKMIGTKDSSTSITRNLSIEYYDLLPYINIGTGDDQFTIVNGGYAFAIKIGAYVIMAFNDITFNTPLTSGYRDLLKTNLPDALRPLNRRVVGIIFGGNANVIDALINIDGEIRLYITLVPNPNRLGLYGTFAYFTNPSFE